VRESCGFTLHLRNVDRKVFPHDSQKGKELDVASRPTVIREKLAGDQPGPTLTRD